MASSTKSQAREWIESIVIAIILAIVIKAFILETVLVEGSSMLPTLRNRDRLAVNKIGYRFGSPQYGDIVVFEYPGDPSLIFIKRVIGLEGDRVEVRDHRVYLNGTELKEPYINESPIMDYPESTVPKGTVFVLGDNRNDSRDSRFSDVGFVPLGNIRGEAVIRMWPLPPGKIE